MFREFVREGIRWWVSGCGRNFFGGFGLEESGGWSRRSRDGDGNGGLKKPGHKGPR